MKHDRKRWVAFLAVAAVFGAGTGAAALTVTGNTKKIFVDAGDRAVNPTATEPTTTFRAPGKSDPQSNEPNRKRTKDPAVKADPKPNPPTQTKRPRPGSSPQPPPVSNAEELEIAPGSVGPVKVGMKLDEAQATGYFDAGPASDPSSSCSASRLEWKSPFNETFEVVTRADGTIIAIEVRAMGPRTAEGFAVGSSWGELSKGPVSDPEGHDDLGTEAVDGSNVWMYNASSGGYIGFFFAEQVDDLTQKSKVAYVEVVKGEKSALHPGSCP